MPQANMLILYVNDPLVSAEFYSQLLHLQPLETAPTFVLFLLPSGIKLGLWSKYTVEPASQLSGGGTELAFLEDSVGNVQSVHDDWKQRGITILQEPTAMDFGFTFVALDPDAHRLRVYMLNRG